jgi:hypothetical protein
VISLSTEIECLVATVDRNLSSAFIGSDDGGWSCYSLERSWRGWHSSRARKFSPPPEWRIVILESSKY